VNGLLAILKSRVFFLIHIPQTQHKISWRLKAIILKQCLEKLLSHEKMGSGKAALREQGSRLIIIKSSLHSSVSLCQALTLQRLPCLWSDCYKMEVERPQASQSMMIRTVFSSISLVSRQPESYFPHIVWVSL
jgi:hypothetical protein